MTRTILKMHRTGKKERKRVDTHPVFLAHFLFILRAGFPGKLHTEKTGIC